VLLPKKKNKVTKYKGQEPLTKQKIFTKKV
jgi:hypothetical protein